MAFEIILEEVEAVEAQLKHEGVLAFQQGRYQDADRLSATGKGLGEFRAKLETLRNEWSSAVDIRTRERVRVEPAYHLQAHKKGPKTTLRIILESGRVIQRPTAAQALADAIEALGVEKVKALGIKVSGVPLVGTEPHAKYGQTPLGRYLVCTHSNTKSKKDVLEQIAKKLNQGLKVEIVGGE